MPELFTAQSDFSNILLIPVPAPEEFLLAWALELLRFDFQKSALDGVTARICEVHEF